jgi:Xaa-Pro aminopeptidase
LIPRVSETELSRRLKVLRDRAAASGAQAALLTSPVSIFYFTNLSFITTERPVALIVPVDGEPFAVLPSVEKGHAEYRNSRWGGVVRRFEYYFDYPGDVHVANLIADAIASSDVRSVMGEPLGPKGAYGYSGPPLQELLAKREVKWIDMGDLVAEMRLVKSEEEVSLIEESGRWASRAVDVARGLMEPGKWDWEVSLQASLEISKEMNNVYRPYVPLRGAVGWAVGFRGQVGEFSAFPHALVAERPMRDGDVIGIGSGPEIGGYFAELERTLILGEPSAEVRELFDKMLKVREAAAEALGPGVKASEVDAAMRRRAKELGVENLLRHHTGHGLGLEEHEPPFLDVGISEVLRPGMVVTVEPGLYVPGLGGFRHSDTFLITEGGARRLTSYPEDIDELKVKR